MRKRALILLAEGYEAVEALTPANFLRRAAIELELCSCEENSLSVASATGISVVCDIRLDQVQDDWGAVPNRLYFVIKHGKVIL